MTKTDILQAESRHAAGMAERIAAEGDARGRRRPTIADLTGDWPDELDLPPAPDGLPATLDEALAEVEASWQWQAAGFDLAAARNAGRRVAGRD